MGNATKVALVALLILMVVVVARFVREDTAAPDPDAEKVTGTKPAASTAKQAPESVARVRQTSVNPGVRRIDAGARSPVTATRPAEGQRSGALTQAGTSGAAGPGTPSPATSPAPSPPVSIPAPGASASPQASTEPATVGVALVDRPPAVPRTSNGEPLPAPPPSGTGSGSAASPESKASGPGALVNSQLKNDGGAGGLSGGTSVRPGQPEPSTARNDAEPGTPSYGALARDPEPKSSEDARSRVPTPGASGRAPSGEYPKTHEVVKNDSYWGLAHKYYGDGRLGSIIEKENPGVPMQPGKKMSIPEPPARPAAAPQAPPRSVARDVSKAAVAVAKADVPKASDEAPQASSGKDLYVVQRGDTLGKIASKFYGDARKTEPLEDANPHLKYQTLQAGAKIKIPAR